MARSISRLSARKVETVKEPGRYADGGNLYLNVDADKQGRPQRRWIMLYTVPGGRRREMSIGNASSVSLIEARELAQAARMHLREGRDPIEERKAERERATASVAATAAPAETTLRVLLEQFVEVHEATWRSEKTKASWLSAFNCHAQSIINLPPSQIDTKKVVAVLSPIWVSHPETASRIRARLERILDRARVLGETDPDRINPARWKGHLQHLLPPQTSLIRGHHAALDWREIPAFMEGLRSDEGVTARLLEWIILSACRSGEARGCRWPELDLKERVWNIPGVRTKTGKDHRVALTLRMIKIAESLLEYRCGEDYLFPAAYKPDVPLSGMATTMWLRRAGFDHVTTHGFRASFKTWCLESTNFARELIEMQLSHQVGGAVERAYQRGDAIARRRELAEAWCRFCAGETGAEVALFNLKKATVGA